MLCWVCYCNSSEVTEVAPLPLATSAQQSELYTLTQACILVRGRTANIYTKSQYTFRVAQDFDIYGNNEVSLPPVGIKLKMAPMSRIY